MSSEVHRYYCTTCKRNLCAAGPDALAKDVNWHNAAYHPGFCMGWNAHLIVGSNQYNISEASTARAEHTKPYQDVRITDDDKDLLAKAHIKW
jgi:hypothetical protein